MASQHPLRHIREAFSLSQRELADATGELDHTTISRIENGRPVRHDDIVKLADALSRHKITPQGLERAIRCVDR
jgi:transcriptional regulator with XRE-family HTH domain